jgi:hypothetical protein
LEAVNEKFRSLPGGLFLQIIEKNNGSWPKFVKL